jgi:protein TonB
MFTTLPESRAIRTRNARSQMASVVLHGALIAGAVAMTLPQRVDATPEPVKDGIPVYVAMRDRPRQPATPIPPRRQAAQPSAPLPTIAAPTIVPSTIPPIDVSGPPLPVEQIVIGGPGARTAPFVDAGGSSVFPPGGIADVGVVERIPRILGGAPAPRYPGALRESGVSGRVVVRFVVDTLGRVEPDAIVVLEATHALFADAVRSALGLYRFSPGEIGGRKVRTMMEQPFTFTLK